MARSVLPADQVSTNENGAFATLEKLDVDVLGRMSALCFLANNRAGRMRWGVHGSHDAAQAAYGTSVPAATSGPQREKVRDRQLA
jgi:hypothetical protein